MLKAKKDTDSTEVSTITSDTAIIYGSFAELHKRRIPIVIANSQAQQKSSTIIADINCDNNRLVLVDVSAQNQIDDIGSNKIFNFSCDISHEQSIYFQEKILHLQNQITNFYFLNLPKTVKIIERRQEQRFEPLANIAVYFSLVNETKYSGSLKNISAGGMQADFKGNLSRKLKSTDLISIGIVPDDPTAFFEALFEIRWVHYVEDEDKTQVGGHFIGLEAAQELVLKHLIERHTNK